MSLRMDIHSAFDEIVPSTFGLAERVVQTTLAEAPNRRRKERWVVRMRPPLSLAAAFLLIALAAGALLGGPLWRDWRNWSTAHPPQVNQAQLRSLESRPLNIPVLQPAVACPISPLTDVSAHGPEALLFGEGPVYAPRLGSGYGPVSTSWGTWTWLSLEVDTTKVSGPILIRARDLRTSELIIFTRIPLAATGQAGDAVPTGTNAGSDVIQGVTSQLYTELVVDTTRPYEGTKRGDWPIFKGFLGYPKTASNCLGLQLDGFHVNGTGFTEFLVLST